MILWFGDTTPMSEPQQDAAALTFREMVPGDIDAGLRLCRASRWNQTAADWAEFLELEPHGARVAVRNGRVVGSVATVRYKDRFAWIGMVLVEPSERGRGIGTRLLELGLQVLTDVPCIRLDATPAGHGLYLKLGFRDEYGHARMGRAGAFEPARVDGDAARPMLRDDLPRVKELDRSVFGADRSALLDWLWAGAPEYARVIARRGALRGFSFGRRGFDFEHVGPVVAEDEATARQLTAACLALPHGRPVVLDAPRHSMEWRGWLEEIGFREQRPFLRMARGENRHPGLPERQFAILGPEFG